MPKNWHKASRARYYDSYRKKKSNGQLLKRFFADRFRDLPCGKQVSLQRSHENDLRLRIIFSNMFFANNVLPNGGREVILALSPFSE